MKKVIDNRIKKWYISIEILIAGAINATHFLF